MTPRPYHPHERQRTVDAGRERVLAAAKDILNLDDVGSFSLDAVEKKAGSHSSNFCSIRRTFC